MGEGLSGLSVGHMDEPRKMVIKFGEARRSYWYKSIARDRRARKADSEVLESAVWHWMWSRRGKSTDRMPLRPLIPRTTTIEPSPPFAQRRKQPVGRRRRGNCRNRKQRARRNRMQEEKRAQRNAFQFERLLPGGRRAVARYS